MNSATATIASAPGTTVVRARRAPYARAISTTAIIALGGLLVLAAVLRVGAYRGYWGTDDGEYALLAHAMASGNYWSFVEQNYIQQFNAPAHLPYRVALVAPLAASFRLFGVSEPALVAYPLVVSLLGVVVAFVAGRMFFGTRAGLVAAALWAVMPVDITFATSFLPDGIASFYASIAVLIVVAAGARAEASPRSLFAAGLTGGLLFGVSWLSKESVTYLVPFCGFLIVAGLRRNPRATLSLWSGVALGAGGVLAAEMAYYWIARGDFWLRMHENERSFVQTRSYLFYEGSRFGWPVGSSHAKALAKRLFMQGPTVFFLNPAFLCLPLIGMIAASRALYQRDRAFTIPAAWMITLIVMYNFASPTFQSYTPLVLLHRYLIPVILPAVVLTAGLIVKLVLEKHGTPDELRERRFWGGLVAVALTLVAAVFTFQQIRALPPIQAMFDTRVAAGYITPNDRVYTDPLSAKALQFYWKYPTASGLVDFEGFTAGDIEPRSYVLVDRNRLSWLDVNVSMWLTSDYGYHEPEFWRQAPDQWTVVWRNEYATLYRVN